MRITSFQKIKLLNMCACTCMLRSFRHVRFCAAPWTAAHQASLSMGFSRQEYWSGSPCSPPGDLPDPGTELLFPMSHALADGLFTTTSVKWEAKK